MVFSPHSLTWQQSLLPNTHLFRFFQIRHFVKSCFPQFPTSPPNSLIDQFLTLNPRKKGLIRITYKQIYTLSPNQLISLRAAWGQDLGAPLSDEQWEEILNNVHSSPICARYSLLQCKILHRAYLTNAKLAKIYPDRADTCNRCGQAPADFVHMFLSCPILFEIWADDNIQSNVDKSIWKSLRLSFSSRISSDN